MVLIVQVLYLVDPIDEVAIQSLKSYKEKNFVDISKEDLDIGNRTVIWLDNSNTGGFISVPFFITVFLVIDLLYCPTISVYLLTLVT